MQFASIELCKLVKPLNAKAHYSILISEKAGAKSADFKGGGRWDEVWVGSGTLKVLGAFWDKLEGTPSAHPASGWHLSDREIASIHGQDSPGHPGRFIAHQIDRHTCNILRSAEPPMGCAAVLSRRTAAGSGAWPMTAAVRSVSTNPGQIAFTRMFSCP